MSFVVPSFPLAVDIYTGPWLTRVLRVSTMGNLAPGRRVFVLPDGEDPGVFIATMQVTLLLPAGTDVRDISTGTLHSDVIECPSGSGRWYGVQIVDDFGKGFANEHRWVMMSKIFDRLNHTEYPGLNWPVPIP